MTVQAVGQRYDHASNGTRKGEAVVPPVLAKGQDIRAVVDSMPALIAFLDSEERFRFANAHYRQLYGLPNSTIIGRPLVRVIGHDAYQRAGPYLARAFAGERVKFENSIFDAAGTVHHLQVEYIPHTADGAVDGICMLVVDITEQKESTKVIEHARDALEARLQRGLSDLERTNAALQESEQRFRQMFEQGPLAIALRSMGGELIVANGAYCALLGYTDDELRMLRVEDTLHPDEVEAIREGIDKLSAGEVEKFETECRYVGKGGVTGWVSATTSVVRDATDKALYSISMLQNIDARKAAEAELQESEQRFRRIFEDGPVGMTLRGLDGRLIAANDACCRMFGYSEAELRELPLEVLMHPEDHSWYQKHFMTLAGGETESYQVERRYVRKSGDIMWAHVSVSMVRDQAGKALYTMCMLNDVTERHQAEQELRLTRDRMRAVLDHSPDGILLKDLDGRYIVNNRAHEAWHAVTPGSLIGKTAYDVYPTGVAAEFVAQDAEILAANEARQYEKEVPFGDRVTRTLDLMKFPVRDGEGAVIGIGAITRDVTEQRRAEIHLRQAQRMEALGRLTGGVAHDFNNLLAVVLGNLELIENRLPPDSDLQGLIDRATRAVDRGSSLVHRLLAFSRSQPLAPEVLDIGQVVREMEDILRRSMSAEYDLVIEADPASWNAELDRTQLENAVLNLAINGAHAMPEGGVLRVATSNVEIADTDGPLAPGRYVRLAVSDHGVGMSAEVKARAIEPFFTTKEVGKGTGLGLSMVHGFVTQSGGAMTIDSEPGEGSTVTLYLPQCDRSDRAGTAVPTDDDLPRGSGETVLVVEDDPQVRLLVATMLDDLGYAAREAADGPQALQVLAGIERLDVLLTDIVLPGGMNGQQVAESVLRARPGASVLYMSGYSDDAYRPESGPQPAVPLLEKPFHRPKVAQALRRALAGWAPARGADRPPM